VSADGTDNRVFRIGALVPLSRPGWVEAGRHLLSGLELAVRDLNGDGGIAGKPIELIVRDTAADPQKASAAVVEFADLGVAAIAGEYHSVVARTAAGRADALGIPFLCSSAVLDELTEQPTKWVARLCPAQSYAWQIYAQFLIDRGHVRIAVASDASIYWESGFRILRDYAAAHGGIVTKYEMRSLQPEALCDELALNRSTALLVLAGFPEPAVSIVSAVRRDPRLAKIMIGAPAGQPEFSEWVKLLGEDGTEVPFLRYLPTHLTGLGNRVKMALRERLGENPSFVGFEGYDTVITLAEMARLQGEHHGRLAEFWPYVTVEGTRGKIKFSRQPGISVWQWAWPPVQIVDRDPADLRTFRILHAS
jgi:ABC-type branched-subunit amino acid transport system substrate-binding protein